MQPIIHVSWGTSPTSTDKDIPSKQSSLEDHSGLSSDVSSSKGPTDDVTQSLQSQSTTRDCSTFEKGDESQWERSSSEREKKVSNCWVFPSRRPKTNGKEKEKEKREEEKELKGERSLSRCQFEDPLEMDLPSLDEFGCSSYALETENLPSRIEAHYTDDFNILEVHQLILKRFEFQRKSRIEHLTQELLTEQEKLKVPLTVIDRKNVLAKIEKLNEQITRLTTRQDIKEYEESVADLIEIYRELGTLPKVVSFSNKKKGTEVETEESRLRHNVISRYLEIARLYIQIDVIRDIPANDSCRGCGLPYFDMMINEDVGILSCPRCGVERCNLLRSPVFGEMGKTQSGTRNGYDDRDNFYKALLRYQGKQQNRLPDNLKDVLDKYFASFGLPVSEEVRKMPLNSDGKTRGATTREMIYRALYETGNAVYYEDVNLICHLYWGWVLPDVSHLEEIIMDDYDRTQKIYEKIPKHRKSNLNTQYRLFKHLQARGWPCSISDFKIVKTREILEYHDATWEIMATEAGLPFIPTI